jgi:hypothetical protein
MNKTDNKMNQAENQKRLLGRILSQPASDTELAAVDAFGGTQIKTGETVGLDTYYNGTYDR